MNKKEAAALTRQIVGQLFNHGWAEDYSGYLEYNDEDKIRRVFELALAGNDLALNSYIDSEEWDEEFNLKQDDGGILSFAIEVGKILRKFRVINDDNQPVKTANVKVHTRYDYICPHCGANNAIEGGDSRETQCKRCENPVKVEGP